MALQEVQQEEPLQSSMVPAQPHKEISFANKETSLTVTKHLPCVLLLNNREIANPSEEKGKPRAYSSSPQHQYFC